MATALPLHCIILLPLLLLAYVPIWAHPPGTTDSQIRDFLDKDGSLNTAQINHKDNFGNTALLYAAREGNLPVYKELIEKGADIHVIDEDERTVLIMAAMGGGATIMEHLLENMDIKKINHQDRLGNTALFYAAWNRHYAIYKQLIEKGADYVINNDQMTVLMAAIMGGDVEIMEHLLENMSIDEINHQNNFGNTALLYAVEKGHYDICKKLIKKGVDIYVTDKDRRTVLIMAAMGGGATIMEHLLENMSIDEINHQDNFGNTALLYAAWNRHYDICKQLIEKGADIHVIDKDRRTVLIMAAMGGGATIMEHLLENMNIKKINHQDRFGNTALFYAAWNRHYAICKQLIEVTAQHLLADLGIALDQFSISEDDGSKNTDSPANYEQLLIEKGADIYATNNRGQTALMAAIMGGDVRIMEHLLKNMSIEEINHHDRSGNTALSHAAKNEHYGICKQLIEKGADIYTTNDRGETALTMAAMGGGATIMEHLLKNMSIEEINHHDNFGSTALLYAAKNEHYGICKQLIEKGADIYAINNWGGTALMAAAMGGSLPIMEHLLRDKKLLEKINHMDRFGNTALSHATMKGRYDICKKLIENGADIYTTHVERGTIQIREPTGGDVTIMGHLLKTMNTEQINRKDDFGNTALLYAAKKRHYDSCMQLINKGADIYVINKERTTVLMAAAMGGSLPIMEHLLRDKKLLEEINRKDDFGNTALFYAAKKGRYDICKKLIENGADIYITHMERGTIRIREPTGGNVTIMNHLLKTMSTAQINRKDDFGNTALLYAIALGSYDNYMQLFNKGANIYATHQYRTTVLMAAAMKGHALIVKHLLTNNTNMVNLKDSFGRTALFLAAENGWLEVVEILLENKANPNISTPSPPPLCFMEQTPEDVAAKMMTRLQKPKKEPDGSVKERIKAYQNIIKCLRQASSDQRPSDSGITKFLKKFVSPVKQKMHRMSNKTDVSNIIMKVPLTTTSTLPACESSAKK